MFASSVLGKAALTETPPAVAVLVGLLAHIVGSAVMGIGYGLLSSRLSRGSRRSFGVQAALGMAYGIGLWLLNIQILGRAFVPWFLETSQVQQILMHALFFGLPLGLLSAAAERRAGDTLKIQP